ncbi:MAG: hypothetical protein WDO06_03830 [Actinomycetota bacterium]
MTMLESQNHLAQAEDCVVAACLSVYTQDDQIIIEGRKDSPPPPPVVVKPRVKRSSTPTPTPTPTSEPNPFSPFTTTQGATVVPLPPQTPTPTPKATPRKWIPKVIPKVVSVSLNDRLIKILPIANISQQPSRGALVGVSVIYWCDLPASFLARVAIVGEIIDVSMKPSFFWSFGDGSIQVTTESGRPFPHESISHTYSRPGNYVVVLMATWGGTWIHNGIAREITGTVRKTTLALVNVQAAPIRFKR